MIENTLALTVLDVFEPYLAVIWNQMEFRNEGRECASLRDTVNTLRDATEAERTGGLPTLHDLRAGLSTTGNATPPPKHSKRLTRLAAAAAAAAGASPAQKASPSCPHKAKRARVASTANMVCWIEQKVCPCGTEITSPRVTCAYITAEDPFTLPLQRLSAYHLSFRTGPPPPLVLNSSFFDAAIASLMETFLVSGSIFEVLQWCLLCEADSFASLNHRLERDYASIAGKGTPSSSATVLRPDSARAQHGQRLVKILNLFPKDALSSVTQKFECAGGKGDDQKVLSSPERAAKEAAFLTFSQWFIRTVALRCFTEVAQPLFLSDKKRSHREKSGGSAVASSGKGKPSALQGQEEGRALFFAEVEPNMRTRPVFQRAAARGAGDPTSAFASTECRVTVEWPADIPATVKQIKMEDGERAGVRPSMLEALRRSGSTSTAAGVTGGVHVLQSHGPLLFTPFSVDELDVASACVDRFFAFAEKHLHPKRRPSERSGRATRTPCHTTVPQVQLFQEVRQQQQTEERLAAETTPKVLLNVSPSTTRRESRPPLPASPTWAPLTPTQWSKTGERTEVDDPDDALSVCWLPYNAPTEEPVTDGGEAQPMATPADTDGLCFTDIIDPACVQLAREAGSSEALSEVGEVLALADKVFSGRIAISDRSWGCGRNRVPVISCSTVLLNQSEREMGENSEPSSQLQPISSTTSSGDGGELGGSKESRSASSLSPDASAHTHVLGLYHHESGVFYNTQMNAYAMDVTAKERW